MKRVLVCALFLAFAGCDGVSGVLVEARWRELSVDALEVVTTVESGVPTSDLIRGAPTLRSPYRLLVRSPEGRSVDIILVAQSGGEARATAHLAARPDAREILEVAVELLPMQAPTSE